jgi:hypothetical protein
MQSFLAMTVFESNSYRKFEVCELGTLQPRWLCASIDYGSSLDCQPPTSAYVVIKNGKFSTLFEQNTACHAGCRHFCGWWALQSLWKIFIA